MSTDVIHFYEKQLDIYDKMMGNGSLTEEQTNSVIDQMANISKMIHDFSSRSTIGLQTVVSFIFSVLGCVVILLFILAGKIIEKPSLSQEQMKVLLAAAPEGEKKE